MEIEEILGLIANTGFSIVVATYLMVRMEKTIQGLDKAIRELTDTIHRTMP